MTTFKSFSINIKGTLRRWDRPAVMGIVNVTPDSFYAPSRTSDAGSIAHRVETMLRQGVDIIDIGAYSTRPGAAPVGRDEELRRLERGLEAVRSIDSRIPVSVDTFRADIARRAVTELGADIINDISGGKFDPAMIATAADTRAPYILTHSTGSEADIHLPQRYDDVTSEVIAALSERLAELRLAGAADVIVDPGFGFGKSVADNYRMLDGLDRFAMLGYPILVGISNKSMIFKPLGISPENAQNGTTALNTIALERGASILRVHDVEAARQAVTLFTLTHA